MGPYLQGEFQFEGVIGIDPCSPEVIPRIVGRADLQGDLSLPTGENGLVERGQGTPSTRSDALYLQGLIALIEQGKGVFDNLALHDLPGIEFRVLQDHPGARSPFRHVRMPAKGKE